MLYFTRFFLRPEGGLWGANEITCLIGSEANKNQITKIVNQSHSDVLYVIFLGHGGIDVNQHFVRDCDAEHIFIEDLLRTKAKKNYCY